MGQFKRYYEGSKLVFVAMALFFFVYLPVVLLTASQGTLLVVLGRMVVLVGGGQVSNHVRGFTSAERVPLGAITAVRPIEGSWWTQPRFVVSYDTGGDEKKRYVMLPSPQLPYTDEEFERAKDLFRRYDLPLEPA